MPAGKGWKVAPKGPAWGWPNWGGESNMGQPVGNLWHLFLQTPIHGLNSIPRHRPLGWSLFLYKRHSHRLTWITCKCAKDCLLKLTSVPKDVRCWSRETKSVQQKLPTEKLFEGVHSIKGAGKNSVLIVMLKNNQ